MRGLAWTILIFGAFFYGAAFTFLPPAFIVPLSIPLLPVTAFVIWALPTTDRMPGPAIRWLFIAVVVAMIAWPNYLAIALPGLPWLTLSRVFIIPLTFLFLVSLSTSQGLRVQLNDVLKENRLAVRFLLLFIATQVLSLPFSSDPFDSFEKFVINQFYWTAMFFAACYVLHDPKSVVRWSWLLVALAVYVAVIGVVEWRLGRVPWAGHIPSFLRIEDESVLRTLAGQSRFGTGQHRVQTTFAESLGCGEYLALTIPLIIHFMIEAHKTWVRWIAAAILPFVLFTIVNTGARVGAVGALAAVLLYSGVWAVRTWLRDRRSILGPSLVLCYPLAAALLLAATMVSGRLRAIVWGGSNTQASNNARITQFQMGWPKVFEAPLGHGVAQAGQVLGYTNGAGAITIDTYTLRLALEYGIIGMLAFYALFITAAATGLKVALRSRDSRTQILLPLCISLVVFLLIKTVYSAEATHAIPFIMLGAVCALVAQARSKQPNPNLQAG